MNLENLSAGLRIANYRKLCSLLDEPICGGTAKTAQLRKWKKYFSFEREKNAYIITEVHQFPHSTDDKRMKYAQYLKPLLLNYLALCGKTELTFDRWYVALGMISSSLLDQEKMMEIKDTYNISSFISQKLTLTVLNICKRSLLSTLNMLEKDQLITQTATEYIVTSIASRPATEEEKKQIDAQKTAAMLAVGAKSTFEVHINIARSKKFYDELHKRYKTECGWERTYTLLEIAPAQESVQQYRNLDVTPIRAQLSARIKASAVKALQAEASNANMHMLDDWETDMASTKFRLDEMTADLMSHILTEEL